MTKKTKTSPIGNTCNMSYAIPKDVANAEFLKTVPKRDNGTNSCAAKFLDVMDSVKACNSASFTVLDVLYHSKAYQLETSQVVELFERWKQVMLSLHKIDVIDGCYDNPIILCLN